MDFIWDSEILYPLVYKEDQITYEFCDFNCLEYNLSLT